jgi:asparagine synthase (glutamine-hydrolysing)
MCGICGFTGEKDPFVLKRMTNAIVHRGPDEEGVYSDGSVNLGIRRLSIVDVETGQQPVHNEDKRIWAVFNGEIYNFRELRRELSETGHTFYTDHSDSELIVHLYEEDGLDFMHRINGMFAIALWDRNQERLLLIRDRMGVKPLFYAPVGGKLIFASEIKAILAHPAYSKDLNYEALFHYFTLKNVPAPATAFAGIHSLLPGEVLIFSRGKTTKKRWWKVRFQEREDWDEFDLREKIMTLLEDATKLRMRSDVPFGAYLSGGVDSSVVVALMSRYAGGPVKTFSLGYEDELKNKEADLYYARKVSEVYGTEHHEYIMSCKELVDDVGDVITAFDQPFSGTIATFFLSKLIARHVKVALSGDAADELFGSYLSHRVAQPMHHFKALQDKVRSCTLTEAEAAFFKPCDISFLSDLYRRSGGDEARWRYQLGVFTDDQKRDLLSRDFLARLNGSGTQALFAAHFRDTTTRDPLNRILEMEWNTQLPDQVLAFIDFLSMAHSVEVRSPFLDYRLVELAATIPGRLKIKDGIVKDILKRAVEPLLPPGITERPKEGFVLPVFDWMVEKMEGFSLDVLSKERLNRHGLFSEEEVGRIVQGYYGGGHRTNAVQIWNLMMFQIWWERYFG